MAEPVLERVRQLLDQESTSPLLLPVPSDFYSGLASYCQKLKRSAGAGASEATQRLVLVQTKLIETMTRDLLVLRVGKAAEQEAFFHLLPEERYVASVRREYGARLEAFLDALSTGQPSFIRYANKEESGRNLLVRFTKHVDELVGLDLKRYGPFEVDDIASIPAANVGILISGGSAVEVRTREEA